MLGRVSTNSFLRSVSISFNTFPVRAYMAGGLPADIRAFLLGYPRTLDTDPNNKRANENLEFYTLKRRCKPDNMLLSEIFEKYSLSTQPISV